MASILKRVISREKSIQSGGNNAPIDAVVEDEKWAIPADSAIKSPLAIGWISLICIIGLWGDLASKAWVLKHIGIPGKEVLRPVIFSGFEGVFRFETVFNPGASWGMLSGKTGLLITLSGVALMAMLYFFASIKKGHWVAITALGMLFAGAFGNTHDRIFNDGNVVDFIYVNFGFWPFNPWPSFNIADSLLCVGVPIFMLCLFREGKKTSPDNG